MGADGQPVRDEQTLERIGLLAIPPAWKDVWICKDPMGHLQATGVDAAGRKQYRYHDLWRERRDREKFTEMLEFARVLPDLRMKLVAEIATGDGLGRERVLALAVRVLDIGLFRIGGERYADEESGIGLATIRREHLSFREGAAIFNYPAKSGVRRIHSITDPDCVEVLRELRRRRGGEAELLHYREGRRWCRVHSDDISEHLKSLVGERFSAKDFRTWNATVLAAVALGATGTTATTKTARRRSINAAVKGVSQMLGNTPAVARSSYIDPRVFDRYLSGWTIAGALEGVENLDSFDEGVRARIETAVIDLIEDPREAEDVERVAA